MTESWFIALDANEILAWKEKNMTEIAIKSDRIIALILLHKTELLLSKKENK